MKPEKKFLRCLDDIERAVVSLRRDGPALLERAAMIAGNDGYPSGSLGGGRGGGPTIKVDNELGQPELVSVTGVEAAALAEPQRDTVGDLAARMLATVEAMATAALGVKDVPLKAKRIQSADGRHSNEPVDCKACDRTIECTTADPNRGGYCNACDVAWRRWRLLEQAAGRCMGDPGEDRLRFERWRRERLAEVGVVRPPCPHRCCVGQDRGVGHEHFHSAVECPECIDLVTVNEVMP